MTPATVVDRWGKAWTQDQIDAIWRYHARLLCDPFKAHFRVLEVYGLAVRRGRWALVTP